MPFAALLGIEVVAATPEEVRARLTWDESRCTAGGILHGGALMGLADSAGGLCAFLNLPASASGTATIESKTNFFRPIGQGHVVRVSGEAVRKAGQAVHRPCRQRGIGRIVRVYVVGLAAKVTQTQAVLGG